MTDRADSGETVTPEENLAASGTQDGWYLYGITPRIPEGQLVADVRTGRQIQVLEFGDLAAVVSPVAAEDFSPETLAERASDSAWLEAMVIAHNEVIAAVHTEQTILPAKFGSVYAGTEDLRTALERMQGPLVTQLRRLQGTDEWAIHAYAARKLIQKRVAVDDAGLAALRAETAAASPGRAYFLQRKLADTLASATEGAVNNLAQETFDHLAAYAVAGQVSPSSRNRIDADREEILRAAFLVARADTDRFLGEVAALSDARVGLEVEATGPWPPYSFAGLQETSS